MPREFIEIPRCINLYAQIYNPAEIEAHFSLVKHITEDEESYQQRINKHIDYYVDNVWEDSKNQDELNKKQLSNQRRKRRHDMRDWILSGSGRSRKQVERFKYNLDVRKQNALKRNSERMKKEDTTIIKYEKKEIEIDYKTKYQEEKRMREKDKRLITELKKQLAEKDDEINKLKRGIKENALKE